MPVNSSQPKRKPVRIPEFDYSSTGAYFVTVCTENRKKILATVEDAATYVKLTNIGRIVENRIKEMNEVYTHISVDAYVVMPNHIHMIVVIEESDNGTSRTPSPTLNVLSQFISTFKRFVNREVGHNIFQRSFYDHIIRNEKDYAEIQKYIENNPVRWYYDKYYQD